MDWFTGIVVFILIWWTALFMVLPWGIRHDAVKDAGTMPGAPSNPALKKRFLATTALSVVIWLVLFTLIKVDIIDFRQISMSMVAEDKGSP